MPKRKMKRKKKKKEENSNQGRRFLMITGIVLALFAISVFVVRALFG